MAGSMPAPPTYFAPQVYPQTYALPAAPYRGAPTTPYRAPAATPAPPKVAQAPRPNNGVIVRGQRPEEPIEPARPVPPRAAEEVRLPSPEELGVGGGRAAEAGLDWAGVHRRLEGLGATCFQMRQLPGGGWHVTCLLPTAQPDRSQRIEAQAADRAEAVRLTLEQAEQWAQRK